MEPGGRRHDDATGTGHLLRRAGLGARPGDYASFAPLSWDAALDRVLDYAVVPDTLPQTLTPRQRRPESDEVRLGPLDVIRWWLDRMVRRGRGRWWRCS